MIASDPNCSIVRDGMKAWLEQCTRRPLAMVATQLFEPNIQLLNASVLKFFAVMFTGRTRKLMTRRPHSNVGVCEH